MRFLFVFCLVCLTGSSFAQSIESPGKTSKNRKGEKVKVIVQFTLDRSGNVDSVWLKKKSNDTSINGEAIRLIRSLPAIDASKQKYRKAIYTQPVTFDIEEAESAEK